MHAKKNAFLIKQSRQEIILTFKIEYIMDDMVKIAVKYKSHRLTMKDRRKKQRFPELNKGNHCNSAAR